MKFTFDNTTCRNCQAHMPEQSLYCPKCSQKNTDGRIPIFDFVKDALENLLNIDSKFFKTSFGLFIPGKLTNEFFKGKHKSFATPSRLFIVSAILFFAMISLLVKEELKDEKMDVFGVNSSTTKKSKEEIIADIERIKNNFPDVISQEMEIQFDSMEARILKDSIKEEHVNFTFWRGKTYYFKKTDFEKLTVDSMLQKYNIEDFRDQMMFKQT